MLTGLPDEDVLETGGPPEALRIEFTSLTATRHRVLPTRDARPARPPYGTPDGSTAAFEMRMRTLREHITLGTDELTERLDAVADDITGPYGPPTSQYGDQLPLTVACCAVAGGEPAVGADLDPRAAEADALRRAAAIYALRNARTALPLSGDLLHAERLTDRRPHPLPASLLLRAAAAGTACAESWDAAVETALFAAVRELARRRARRKLSPPPAGGRSPVYRTARRPGTGDCCGRSAPHRRCGTSRTARARRSSGWTFHELLAFDGSRAGPRDRSFGPVFPLRGTEQPEPPCRPLPAGRRVPLHRPDLARTAREDRPFTEVLEDRRSRRAFGDRPLTRRQSGSFLHRAARVRTVLSARSEDDRPYAVTSRLCPSAGSAYELELYAAVRRCDGLDPGLYHYDPLGHALTELPDHPGAMDQLLREASAAAGERAVPDVHLTVVSRIKRLPWKYAAHSYALTLKNTGVLLQTLSLVAGAMDLAGCVLGGGGSDTPVRAFRLAPYAEIPVGGFLLGTAVRAGSGEQR
ncbi:SagB family peptide dehydrogenase [Streptomyces sp. MA15]|uniref:SagB family peptide dehydrogenase n=1 Tax=Streptomyces sp. MA15 TaxID=3055061 RepID=UPI00339DA4A6